MYFRVNFCMECKLMIGFVAIAGKIAIFIVHKKTGNLFAHLLGHTSYISSLHSFPILHNHVFSTGE